MDQVVGYSGWCEIFGSCCGVLLMGIGVVMLKWI